MDEQHLIAGQWVTDIVEKFYLHGKLHKTLHSFAFTVAKWSGGISLEDCGRGGEFYIGVDEEFAKPLTELAHMHYHFYDLCIDVLAFGRTFDKKLPEPLEEFSIGVLTGLIKRPKPPHAERRTVWLEKFLMWSLAHDVNDMFGVGFSENEATSSKNTACHIVAKAFGVCGRPTKYSEVYNVLFHPDYKSYRPEFEVALKVRGRERPLAKNDFSDNENKLLRRACFEADFADICSALGRVG